MLLGLNVFFFHFNATYSIPEHSHPIFKYLQRFWRCISILSLSSTLILTITDLYYKYDYPFVEISSHYMISVIYVGATFRGIYCIANDYKVKNIVEKLNEIFRFESQSGFQEKSIGNTTKVANVLLVWWTSACFCTGPLSAVMPLIWPKIFGRMIPIPAWYPYDWRLPGYYEFTLLTQALTQFFTGLVYGNSDMFYVCTLHLTTSQFRLLNWEFENILYTALMTYGVDTEKVLAFSKNFNVDNDEDAQIINAENDYEEVVDIVNSKDFEEVFAQCLNEKIKIHQDLIKFCDLLDEFFSPLLLPSLGFCLFYIIFIAFTLVVTTDHSSFVGLIEYLSTALVQVFMLSYFGHMLTDQCEQVRGGLYASPWFICSSRFLSTFKFIQYRLSKPVVLRAGHYFVMSLELFIAVCQTSASYFAVLRQVTEQEK